VAAPEEVVEAIARADSWDARIGLIRKVPEQFGTSQHAAIYAAIASRVYVPYLAPDFAYVHWRDEYELSAVEKPYSLAHDLTRAFTEVDPEDIARTLETEPTTLRVFRLLVGFTTQEFAASTAIVGRSLDIEGISPNRAKSIEEGSALSMEDAVLCAEVHASPPLLRQRPAGWRRATSATAARFHRKADRGACLLEARSAGRRRGGA